MTVVSDQSIQPEQASHSKPSPSLFQKICCCCCTHDTTQEPVQLIRNSQRYTQSEPNGSSNNATDHTTDGDNSLQSLDASNLEERTSREHHNNEKNDSINMNDIFIDEVLQNADQSEVIVEEAVSISGDVVQEINDEDLKNIKKTHDSPPVLKARQAYARVDTCSINSSSDDDNGSHHKMSVLEFLRSGAQVEEENVKIDNNTVEINEQRDISRSLNNSNDNKSLHSTKNEQVSIASISEITDEDSSKEQSNNSVQSTSRSFTKEHEHQEIVLDFTETVDQLDHILEANDRAPTPPPAETIPDETIPAKTSSVPRMYAHADSSDSSSDEESGEARTVSNIGLSKMEPVNFADKPALVDDDQSSVISDSSENESEHCEIYTRISLKSDGRVEIHSPLGEVRAAIDADSQVTDDEFSEKLI